MNEYLRDFINENVGEECGGQASVVNPNTLQRQVNELKARVDSLEGGIGFAVEISDQITIPFTLTNGTFVAIVPTDGTITMASTLSDVAGDADGLTSLTLVVHKSDGTTASYTYDINHTVRANTAITSIQVYSGDWLSLSATTYVLSDVIGEASLIACSTILQLPANVYGVGNA